MLRQLKWRVWLVLAAMPLTSTCLAFEINQDFLNGSDAVQPLPPVYERRAASRARQPIHEVWLDLAIAAAPNSIVCPVSAATVSAYVAPVSKAEISGFLCCGPGADSNICQSGDAVRYPDLNSFRRGVTWNDNPCHVSKYKYGPWAGLPRRYRRPNLSIRSHREDLQFLHAMASKGEPAEVTLQAMSAWAEFAYLVAAGQILPTSTIGAATELLSPASAEVLSRRFPEPYASNWSVGLLYSGVFRYQDRQIKLLALGSLIHMLQDSYSDSHVLRDPRTFSKGAGRPQLRNSGGIVAFRSFGDQRPTLHLKADKMPLDFVQQSSPNSQNDLPVIAAAAELIACAARDAQVSGEAAQSWPVIERLLRNGPFVTAEGFRPDGLPQNDGYK